MLRFGSKALLAAFLSLVVLAAGYGDFRPPSLDLTVAPHKYSLVSWEVSHFFDKWTQKLWDLRPWYSDPSRQEKISQVRVYFELGEHLRELERSSSAPASGSIRAEIEAIKKQRERMQPAVEETIEAEISAVIAAEGFDTRIGLIFPPVDTVFSRSPGVLIMSPRDSIHRQQTILLKPGLNDETRSKIEAQILLDQNLSALVENTGGVATYPSVVSESGGLRHTIVTVAHEWLHHWFFFQPLGQHFWDDARMITLNETAATLGGQAIGDRAFTAITGEEVVRDAVPLPPQDSGAFDFNSAMRETRLHTEELLAGGEIEAAEAFMEERRQFINTNGYNIRKINQAYFAFHGSYATSAASISPIDEQLRALQEQSESLEEFIKTVATFGSYEEFLEHYEGLEQPSTEAAVGALGSKPGRP